LVFAVAALFGRSLTGAGAFFSFLAIGFFATLPVLS